MTGSSGDAVVLALLQAGHLSSEDLLQPARQVRAAPAPDHETFAPVLELCTTIVHAAHARGHSDGSGAARGFGQGARNIRTMRCSGTASGMPSSRRRYASLFEGVQAAPPRAARPRLSIHRPRHTTRTDISMTAGVRIVAE